jgi:tRNA1Val (adenine37-N6)-methyltransferase
MPNDYFQFKQFRIDQSDCAQKVSTDACLLGATVDLTNATHILDLGTGTGLLALMAAQRAPNAKIEAIEIDLAAAAQAATNVAASPWADRIWVHALSLASYAASLPPSFSHIICNPPFFRRSLAPPDVARATARHAGEDSLTFGDIAAFAAAHLLPGGTLTEWVGRTGAVDGAAPPGRAHYAVYLCIRGGRDCRSSGNRVDYSGRGWGVLNGVSGAAG